MPSTMILLNLLSDAVQTTIFLNFHERTSKCPLYNYYNFGISLVYETSETNNNIKLLIKTPLLDFPTESYFTNGVHHAVFVQTSGTKVVQLTSLLYMTKEYLILLPGRGIF